MSNFVCLFLHNTRYTVSNYKRRRYLMWDRSHTHSPPPANYQTIRISMQSAYPNAPVGTSSARSLPNWFGMQCVERTGPSQIFYLLLWIGAFGVSMQRTELGKGAKPHNDKCSMLHEYQHEPATHTNNYARGIQQIHFCASTPGVLDCGRHAIE